MSGPQNGIRDNVQGPAYDTSKGGLESRYYHFEGLAMLPMANATGGNCGSFEVVRLHSPVRNRIMNFDFTKVGTPPLTPQPASNSLEYIINSDLHLPFPSLGADSNTYTWNSYAQYTFVENSQWNITGGFRIGDVPIQSPASQLYGVGGTVDGMTIGYANNATFAEKLGNAATFQASSDSMLKNFFTYGDASELANMSTLRNFGGGGGGPVGGDYSSYQYNFPWHFPSAFLSVDIGIGI